MKHFLLALVLATILPVAAEAHALGASLERAVGNNFIDIGYEPTDPAEGDRMVFDFNVTALDTGENIEFDSVWVRIADTSGDNEQTLLATGIGYANIGATTLLFQLPDDIQEMSLSARFEKEGVSLAEAEFSLSVASTKPAYLWPALYAGTTALVLLAALLWLWRMKRKKDASFFASLP